MVLHARGWLGLTLIQSSDVSVLHFGVYVGPFCHCCTDDVFLWRRFGVVLHKASDVLDEVEV